MSSALGKELRQARISVRMTQEALSSAAKVDRSYISQIERDLKSPTVDMLLRLCQAMGVSAANIIARIEKK